MHQFAISLIWGIYENGRLGETFRYMEDGSFNTVDEEEYTLPDEASIGLVHPIELTDEALAAWKQQLEDYEITQSIDQLSRPIYRLPAEQAQDTALETAAGRRLNDLSLAGKLQGMGWYRGSVVDGGGFHLLPGGPSCWDRVELNFSGSFVGGENETVTVYDAVFYRAGTVARGSYCYDEAKRGTSSRWDRSRLAITVRSYGSWSGLLHPAQRPIRTGRTVGSDPNYESGPGAKPRAGSIKSPASAGLFDKPRPGSLIQAARSALYARSVRSREICGSSHPYRQKDIGKHPLLSSGDGQTDGGTAARVVKLIAAQLAQLHAAQHGLELPKDVGRGAVGGVHDLRLFNVDHALDGGQNVGDGGLSGVSPR